VASHAELPTGVRAGWRDVLAWLARRRRRVRVAGDSMVPALRDGDHVLVDEGRRDPLPGALVWITHPDRPELAMVKRVLRVEDGGALYVVGDNAAASTDSRQLGALDRALLRGTVVWRFAR